MFFHEHLNVSATKGWNSAKLFRRKQASLPHLTKEEGRQGWWRLREQRKNPKKPKRDGTPKDPTHLGAMVTNTRKVADWDCKKSYHAIFTKQVNRKTPPFNADGLSACNKWHCQGYCLQDCARSASHKPFSDETLKKNYGDWVKDLKKKYQEKPWRAEQDRGVDKNNLLTETLHAYPARAHHHSISPHISVGSSATKSNNHSNRSTDNSGSSPSTSIPIEAQSSSGKLRIIANSKPLAKIPIATSRASAWDHSKEVQLTPLNQSAIGHPSMVSTSNQSQPSSAIARAGHLGIKTERQHQLLQSSKLSGSIPKPVACHPFNLSVNDSKISGELNNVLHKDFIPPDAPGSEATDQAAAIIQDSYLPPIVALLPPPQPCPVNISDSPSWLLPTIEDIISTPSYRLAESPFIFSLTPDAASHNMLVLMAHDFNIKTVIDNHQHTSLRHGSEFREISSLNKLLLHHPRNQNSSLY